MIPNETLAGLDGTRIEHKWNAARITERVLEVVGAGGLADDAHQVRELMSQPDNPLSSTFAAQLGYTDAGLAEMAADMGHNPENLSDFSDEIRAFAAGNGTRLACLAAQLGWELTRHVTEQVLVETCENVEMAGVEREHDRVDLTVDGETIQVISSTKDYPPHWTTKYNDLESADDADFDYYVVLKMNDDGTLGVGVEPMDENYDGTKARTKAKNA